MNRINNSEATVLYKTTLNMIKEASRFIKSGLRIKLCWEICYFENKINIYPLFKGFLKMQFLWIKI